MGKLKALTHFVASNRFGTEFRTHQLHTPWNSEIFGPLFESTDHGAEFAASLFAVFPNFRLKQSCSENSYGPNQAKRPNRLT